ncbi:hypothetical protein [Nonomuraea aurantiaca]|uniref:hypothetical protein n=1 Tax=Nonomuraea aurantiaca TaxID=2878562 RepID=UPI001CD92A1B|nr:hypothetical protein [Nonomuraea aurantiaca]MCA2230253.1 hypothetical protein [Nonomuraea aurantiaca]
MAESEGVAFVQADVERFCAELVGVAPAIRLARLAELRVMLEDVVAMAEARDEGWGLRRIGRQIGMSHEQVRRTLAKPLPEPERA